MFVLYSFAWLLAWVIRVLIWLIVVDVVISWLPAFGVTVSRRHPVPRLVSAIVEPILRPIRRVVPPERLGGWDFSPFIAIVLLNYLRGWLFGC